MHDLALIVVSTNEASWLPACLSSVFAHRGDCSLDVVVVDNESIDGTAELVEREFPNARVIRSSNRGFSHANNRALMTCKARYVLFLNPDTEIREGTLGDLVRSLDERPAVGLAGVIQVLPDGSLLPTIRRFPNALRALGQALGSERFPLAGRWLRERELDDSIYPNEGECDWTSGSFMIVRQEAIASSGFLDERFFIYSEETDLCRRIKGAGWTICHLPTMTIVHHAGKAGLSERMAAQDAYARTLYARKHFSPAHRLAYGGALALGYMARAAFPGRSAGAAERRAASSAALRMLLRRSSPPFGEPPRHAVAHDRRS